MSLQSPYLLIATTCLLLALVLNLGACAGVLPPSRTDVGTVLAKPNGEMLTGVRFSSGVQSASAIASQDTEYDLGVGYVYERLESSGSDITSKHVEGQGARDQVSHGTYVSIDRVLSRNKQYHQRTWLGMRGEYMRSRHGDGGDMLSLLARLNWEVHGKAVGAGAEATNCGFISAMSYGTIGLGFFAEAGARRSFEGEATFVASLGLSLRLPFLAGMGFGLCD